MIQHQNFKFEIINLSLKEDGDAWYFLYISFVSLKKEEFA
jgi:hypothetical protein